MPRGLSEAAASRHSVAPHKPLVATMMAKAAEFKALHSLSLDAVEVKYAG